MVNTYEIHFTTVPPHLSDSNLLPLELIDKYLHNQRDPMIGSQTKRVQYKREQWGWRMISTLPLQINVPENREDKTIDWSNVTEEQSQSNALWKYSIGYLPTLLESTNNLELVSSVLDSFWQYTQKKEWIKRAGWMTSLDHALAVRIRAITTLKCLYDKHEVSLPESAFLILINDVANILKNPTVYFPLNNHGAMVCVSLMHASGIFPGIDKFFREFEMGSVIDVTGRHFRQILTDIFDEFGVASENSPEYQRYWIALLRPVREFIDTWKVEIDTLDLGTLIEKAEFGLSLFIDNSQKLLPIGDSSPSMIKAKGCGPANFVSEKSGFAVYREEGTIFTFNCGSTNYAHKHCDDSSITLSYGTENLILDAGYFSHDWKDDRAIFAKSQNAHSGLFLSEYDDLHPGQMYWPGAERISASMSRITSSSFCVEGEVDIDRKFLLRRKVEAHGPNRFTLEDSVHGQFDADQEAVIRFILPIGSTVQTSGFSVIVRYKNVEMELIFSGLNSAPQQRVTTAGDHTSYKGWVADRPGTLSPAVCLEVPIPLHTRIFTSILLRDLDPVQ